ncbi:hypothetical protein BGW80DRAFT_1324069 [Lactifluus volemus]|nr:hypothetical protein BGW80DRAFT_1324069 [Lactifluus volemus]
MFLMCWIFSVLLADIGYSFNKPTVDISDCLVLGAKIICFPFITFLRQLPIDKFHIYHKPTLWVTRHELPCTSRACHTTITPSGLWQSVLRW